MVRVEMGGVGGSLGGKVTAQQSSQRQGESCDEHVDGQGAGFRGSLALLALDLSGWVGLGDHQPHSASN